MRLLRLRGARLLMAWKKWRGTADRGCWHAHWWERSGGDRKKRSRRLSRHEATAERLLGEIRRNLALRAAGLGQLVGWERLAEDYLRLLAADGGAPAYISRVGIVLRHVARLYPRLMVAEISPRLLDDYKLRRAGEGIEASTLNRELGMIKAAVRKGKRWQYQVQDLGEVGRVKEIEKVRLGFSPDEIRALRAAADPILQLVLMLGLYAGLRRGELLALRWVDVDLRRKTLLLGAGWRTKNRRARALPLHPVLEAALRAEKEARRPQPADPVVPWTTSAQNLSARFRYFLRSKVHIPHGTLHSLRHTFITELKRSDVDTGKVQRMAGHRSERTTQAYTHLDTKDLKEGIGRLNFEYDDK